ncbi:MAG: malonate decarboxylase subunit epsilon [Betaproteobacteria bacterium]|nr:malonate decarboxylase subunit epsilon [Betaproteobacteria bacterium]NCP82323.1 malonate decarboxylase subunit epsilon [Rhodoferax sp.]OIP16177.1 MAG: hypothetical protein AUK50_09570 [Comamonadaceae bacterium CG2_30_57_122]PIZ23986.1 MAG: ACP S-malonyltransferase [Comamonadaceae bacterium CG_4_10_14_0_8_um_filter_57_29]PJC16958.1 MAG: ACP S-malonyltransferase [Comamonadaceae bacterium CG_4_9_14_0_8_um_filter_57_21]
MNYAVLFSGQASQHPDMLPWLEAEPACSHALALMAAHLGADWRQQLQDPATRSHNAFAQVLITGAALAAWTALQQRLPGAPAVVAGYSVGELAAFGCAGVLTTAQAIDLAALRAHLMDQAVDKLDTGLLAVTGLSEAMVQATCVNLGLECAIRISPSQHVFAGTDAALNHALPQLTARGAQCTRLEVRVASHSSWMLPAIDAFWQALSSEPFGNPLCPVALNATGTLCRQPNQLRAGLSQQLAHTVQWSTCMDAIAERQVACVLEVGGGTALARMWNDQHPNIPARALDDFRQPQRAVDWLMKLGGSTG